MDNQQHIKQFPQFIQNKPCGIDTFDGGSHSRLAKTIARHFRHNDIQDDKNVDILVLLDKSRPIGLKFFGMWSDLEDLLGRKVDLVSEGTLLPFAQESANKDKILIYERTE